MKYAFHFTLAIILSISGLVPIYAQDSNSPKTDRIYSSGDVDKEAVVENLDQVYRNLISELDCRSIGKIGTIRLVLHKSGKVTNVKVKVKSGCQISERAIDMLRQIRFTPAIKNKLPVSQKFKIEVEQIINTRN